MVIVNNNPCRQNRTTLDVTEVTHCVDLCMETIFAFRYCLFQRTAGSPMGCSISSLLINKQTIDTFGLTPPIIGKTRLNQMLKKIRARHLCSTENPTKRKTTQFRGTSVQL